MKAEGVACGKRLLQRHSPSCNRPSGARAEAAPAAADDARLNVPLLGDRACCDLPGRNQLCARRERAQRHHRGYNERARQPPRPIRALRRHGLRLSRPPSGGANGTSPNATGIATERAKIKQNEATRNRSPEADSTDKSASGGTGGDRTKRHIQNFKTGALNHSATLPSLQEQTLTDITTWSAARRCPPHCFGIVQRHYIRPSHCCATALA